MAQYTPTPTLALTFLNGFTPQPANPFFFSSDEEAQKMLKDVLRDCPELVSLGTRLIDQPSSIGPIIYMDARKVWVIEFTQGGMKNGSWVGWLQWREWMNPAPWKWALSPEWGVGLIRVPA